MGYRLGRTGTLVRIMEKFKELGFTTCAIALGFCNLVTFALIIFLGKAPYIVENCPWILYTEVGLNLGYISWGIERLIKDLRRCE